MEHVCLAGQIWYYAKLQLRHAPFALVLQGKADVFANLPLQAVKPIARDFPQPVPDATKNQNIGVD
jgi:hypothetical protein